MTPVEGAVPKTNWSASKVELERKALTELTVTIPRGSNTPDPTSSAKAISPLPLAKVRSKVPLTVLLNAISPPVFPVVVMVEAPVARITGLLKVILAPSPTRPVPPPAAPPEALIVLLLRVTDNPPLELMVIDPASPPSELFRELAPPEVSMLAKPIVPVLVVIERSPPAPPAPALEAPPSALILPVMETFPLTPPIVIAPAALPTPALFDAPVVSKSPAKVIVPVPVAVIDTSPESVPLLDPAAVSIVCAAAKSTPPIPPVKVTAPPAVSIPAFRSKVAPSRVTLVVAPVAAMAPSTCTSPPVPLERITTESRKDEVSTVINPVWALCPIVIDVAPSAIAARSVSLRSKVPAPPPTPIVVPAVAP